ncbi:MAG: NRDE family protein, partial [Betaproteobacteria bacterium]
MAMAWLVHPHLPLVLAANRDEFHDRAARPMAWWEGQD